MEIKRRLSLVVAILSVALGAGHLVQNVLVKPAKLLATVADMKPVDITLVAAGPESGLLLPEPAVMELPASFAVVPNDDSRSLFTLPVDPVQRADFTGALPETDVAANICPVELDLVAEPSAMIGVTLVAPCHADERVVLRHAGLAVTGKTSASGTLFASVPAFLSEAVVAVRFGDGQIAEANLDIPEAANFRRFGVQWLDHDAFQVNAFEDGASYGETGHVSAAYPQVPLAGQSQVGGFLSVLGDDQVSLPMLAEVYTYPLDAGTPVRIVIEAAITKGTCGREILGETLSEVGGDVTITDLSLQMPDCSAVGDILILKDLDPNLKLAAAN